MKNQKIAVFCAALVISLAFFVLLAYAQDPGTMEFWDAGEQPPEPPVGPPSVGGLEYWDAEEEPPVLSEATDTPTPTPTPTNTPTPTATPCISAWDDLCVSGVGVVQLSGAYLCATPSIYSFGHWFNDPTPTAGVAYVNHDVPQGDEGDFSSCLRPSQLYTTTMEIMRAVEIADTNPCTSTLNSVWRLRYLPSGSADLVCDVCSPVMYWNVGALPTATWTTFRVDWDLPVSPATGSITVYRNGTPVINPSGIGMAAGGAHHEAEAVQVGILDWDQSGRNTWFHSDESYDHFNQETCTPTPTGTITPTPTVTPTGTITPTPTVTVTPGGPTETPTALPATPTPHGTPVALFAGADSFLCDCDCEESYGTPTATPTPTGEWSVCWSSSNEQWLPGNDDWGDWDGGWTNDWADYGIALSTQPVYDGLYSYSHTGYGHTPLVGAPYLQCPEAKSTGWFTGHAYFDSLPLVAMTHEEILGFDYFPDSGPRTNGLHLWVDPWDSFKIKLDCPATTGLCAALESYTCYNAGISAGQWYTYTVYFDLPHNVANGRIDCWWDGVHTVDDNAVQTGNLSWRGYNRIFSGITDWHILSAGTTIYTDDLQDCACELVGNVTPVPPP